jgi:hypothetical protein
LAGAINERPDTGGLKLVKGPKPDVDVGQVVERAGKNPTGVSSLSKGEQTLMSRRKSAHQEGASCSPVECKGVLLLIAHDFGPCGRLVLATECSVVVDVEETHCCVVIG